ncbi:CocE/NonD family hydrolase [Bergeyella sp. RCAD1439]|uniref:CocE/NonD family hydrolase n=1 Tax=Bergeyella anatis TaxID=3113737 RepID=UPI002E184583|nr:CocE/NonD family hydrolase [Bergeyella sp. RCAD1439]
MKFGFRFIFFIFSFWGLAQSSQNSDYVKEHFDKKEVYIPMRDGIKLFTAIYIPKDIAKSQKYPFLMQRTCYSIAPYGENEYRSSLGPNPFLMKEKYIFVYQDVRGRYMSEGTFTNMTPQVSRKTRQNVDESTDTYDTIEWLLKNIPHHNGKVGQYGTSYPGFYTAVGTLSRHPALVASSPQAPIADFWHDDFMHNGRFMLGYFRTFPVFGVPKTKAENKAWYSDSMIKTSSEDGLKFYRELGTLKEGYEKYYKDNVFMTQIMQHPNYDEFWQKRNLLPHLKGISHAVMTVGGWYDAEDLYGPLNIYKTIEKNNPKAQNTIVMGPFSHGGWSKEQGSHFHNAIYFGDSLATFYQKNLETPFFNHYLKGNTKAKAALPEAMMYDTGSKQWRAFDAYPPKETRKIKFHLADKTLKTEPSDSYTQYYSDPENPVPSSTDLKGFNGFTPRNYMTEDQRFALSRPDVLTFTSEVLTQDLTFAGELMARLNIASSSDDADFVVKLIDVYPEDFKPVQKKEGIVYGNYHQMVRSEIMPARFRESKETPKPLVPNEKTPIEFPLQDVVHTFKKGHRIQIQIASTWFPLFTVNPQKYIDNVNLATKEDYTKAFIKIFGDSFIEADVLP